MSGSRDNDGEGQPDWLPADLLAFAREQRATAVHAEARLLQAAVAWAVMHPAESIIDAATLVERGFGDTGIPVAGEGAPLVAEFSIAEFATAVGLTTDAGRRYVGHAVELRYRLKRVWQKVTTGRLVAWKARRIADTTLILSAEAAGYVDKHVAPVAHKIGPAQLDRLVTEAITRYMPERAEQERRAAWDQTHFDVDYASVGIAGTCRVTGEIDLADALDLDHALATDAQTQAQLGSTRTLEQRRATALGNIARRDLTLTYPEDGGSGESDEQPRPTVSRRPGRTTVLYLHLSQAAIGGHDTVGRVENTRTPVTAETIRAWCGSPATTRLVVKPVIDLAEHVHVEAYEIPDRIREAIALRDLTCIFPWCTRPARRVRPDEHAADCDHHTPYADGGATCSCQTAPLCRTHHRLKTHGGWEYRIIEPGSYLWRSPHGYEFLRDHTGTLDVSHDRHTRTPPQSDPPPQADPEPDPPPGDD